MYLIPKQIEQNIEWLDETVQEYRQLEFIPNKEEEPPQPLPEVLEEPVKEEILPEPPEEPHHPAAEVDDEPEPTPTADLLVTPGNMTLYSYQLFTAINGSS